MQEARDDQGARDAEEPWHAEQAFGSVEFVVLARVDDVEPGRPERDGGGEPEDARVEVAADGDPGGRRSDAEAEAKDDVGEGCKAFGEGVEEYDGERDRRQPEAERIQRPRGEEEDGRGDHDESPCECPGEQAGRDVSRPGARVASVDRGVDDAVEGHRRRTGADHGDDDPEQLAPEIAGGETGLAKRQQRAGQREREREDRVLELDHVERHPEAFEDHGGFPLFYAKRRVTLAFRGCYKPPPCPIVVVSGATTKIVAWPSRKSDSTSWRTGWAGPRRASARRGWPSIQSPRWSARPGSAIRRCCCGR